MHDKKELLIVEDNDGLRMLLRHYLKQYFKVVPLTNGLEALKWLQAGNFPDVILLDMGLPELSGTELMDLIQCSGSLQLIPIVAISGDNERLEEIESPQYQRLKKPFDPQHLVDCINAATDPPLAIFST